MEVEPRAAAWCAGPGGEAVEAASTTGTVARVELAGAERGVRQRGSVVRSDRQAAVDAEIGERLLNAY